jgi:hypothetical protein
VIRPRDWAIPAASPPIHIARMIATAIFVSGLEKSPKEPPRAT